MHNKSCVSRQTRMTHNLARNGTIPQNMNDSSFRIHNPCVHVKQPTFGSEAVYNVCGTCIYLGENMHLKSNTEY